MLRRADANVYIIIIDFFKYTKKMIMMDIFHIIVEFVSDSDITRLSNVSSEFKLFMYKYYPSNIRHKCIISCNLGYLFYHRLSDKEIEFIKEKSYCQAGICIYQIYEGPNRDYAILSSWASNKFALSIERDIYDDYNN